MKRKRLNNADIILPLTEERKSDLKVQYPLKSIPSRSLDFFFKRTLDADKKQSTLIDEALANHPDISLKIRAKLFDWIYQASIALCLQMKTFYIALNVIDGVLCKSRSIKLEHFQLLGVTALYMSAKFNEVSYSKPETYTTLIDGMHSVAELYLFEAKIIKTVSFSIFCEPTVYDYILKYYEDLFPTIKSYDKENFIQNKHAAFEPFSTQYSQSPEYKRGLRQLIELLNFYLYLDVRAAFDKHEVALLVLNATFKLPIQTLKKFSGRIARRGAVPRKLKKQTKAFWKYIQDKENTSWHNRYVKDSHYYDQEAFNVYLNNL